MVVHVHSVTAVQKMAVVVKLAITVDMDVNLAMVDVILMNLKLLQPKQLEPNQP